ncbi:MAG: hypothetical protein AAF502_18790 [Bacteroidota bacterium]
MKMEEGTLRYALLIFLAQVIIYLGVWLWDDYIAKFLTLLMVAITVGVLVVSLIAELIERSKVPGIYFIFMVISILTPFLVALLVIGIGAAEWTFDEPLIRNK